MNVIKLTTFEISKLNGIDTDWCICHFEDQFNLYHDLYEIFIIENKNFEGNDKFRKICYLKNDETEMIVDKDNVHYFNDSKNFIELKNKLVPDSI